MIRLYINWYNDKNDNRQKELDFCLDKNINNNCIDEIINLSNVELPNCKNYFIANRPMIKDFFYISR